MIVLYKRHRKDKVPVSFFLLISYKSKCFKTDNKIEIKLLHFHKKYIII